MLKVHNTLTRQKQTLEPIHPGHIGMYVCGMTVYDYCHIGHARVMVVFDVICRWLRASGFTVKYVRNITDIDDKIIKRAQENNETVAALTQRFIDFMNEDADTLGTERPDVQPRATQHVPNMIRLIELLVARGLAYQAGNGDVYYSVHEFAGYGKLSGKSLEDLRAGERVAANDAKQDPLDFALWKHAKAGEPADCTWDSKYGPGRPGWHIECSAMGCTLLGEHFDLHGGGQDLQFPHHENEIAQSEGATGQTFVNYWMHNGFVQIDNEKMSKSLGNFFTIRDVIAKYDPEVVRFFLARTHYRSPLNYSDVHLDDARAALTRLYTALKDVTPDTAPLDWSEPYAQRFRDAMNDDFNTPVAVAALFELATELNRTGDAALARQLHALAGTLGLLGRDPRAFLQHAAGERASGGLDAAAIAAKIAERAAAKGAKNYAEADRIRAQLLEAGVALEDKPGGLTEWRRV